MSFVTEFPDENSQAREIYANFGLAAYMASVFEEGVAIQATTITLIKDVREGKIRTKAEWEARYDAEIALAHGLPLGRGLIRLQAILRLSSQTQDLFAEALRCRNYLIHHFFRDEIHEFYSETGRTLMYEKLSSWVDLFTRADRALSFATEPIRSKIGLTEQRLRRHLEQLETEYRSR